METLELQHYLNEGKKLGVSLLPYILLSSGYGPFKQCSIKSYNYDNLTVQYGEHIVSTFRLTELNNYIPLD